MSVTPKPKCYLISWLLVSWSISFRSLVDSPLDLYVGGLYSASSAIYQRFPPPLRPMKQPAPFRAIKWPHVLTGKLKRETVWAVFDSAELSTGRCGNEKESDGTFPNFPYRGSLQDAFFSGAGNRLQSGRHLEGRAYQQYIAYSFFLENYPLDSAFILYADTVRSLGMAFRVIFVPEFIRDPAEISYVGFNGINGVNAKPRQCGFLSSLKVTAAQKCSLITFCL